MLDFYIEEYVGSWWAGIMQTLLTASERRKWELCECISSVWRGPTLPFWHEGYMWLQNALSLSNITSTWYLSIHTRRHIHLPLLSILSPISSLSSLAPPLPPLCLFLSSYLESLTEAWWLDTPHSPSILSSPSSSHLTPPLQSLWSPCPCNTPTELTRLVQSACALSL